MDDKFSPHIREVALELWGEPNPRLTTKTEIRWGRQGSRSVDVERGVWKNHEEGTGGGVLDLIMTVNGVTKAQAAEWMEQKGFIQGDQPSGGAARPAAGSNRGSGPREAEPHPKAQIVATYDYVDEAGKMIFQVVRMEVPGRPDIPKTFRQRRPDPSARDGWNWKRGDVRQVPYRLPEVRAAIAKGLVVFVCYTPDTEVLTPAGWRRFDDLPRDVPVAQWDMATEAISFAQPSAYQKFAYSGDLIHLRSAFSDLLVTPDHRQPVLAQRDGVARPSVITAAEVKWGRRLPVSGVASGSVAMSPLRARIIAAWLADGVDEKRGFKTSWNIKKERKKKRLRALLTEAGVPFVEREFPSTPGWTNFSVYRDDLDFIWPAVDGKSWAWSSLDWSEAARAAALDELAEWDGDRIGRIGVRYFTGCRQSADVVAAMAALTGWRCIARTDCRPGRTDSYVVNIAPQRWRQLSRTPARVPYDGDVYCCTVPTGFLVVRRNGKVTISGNCEGEKDVDALWAAGVPATCNAGGAGKWPKELSDHFNGARVVILPDNDKPGRDHRNMVGQALHRIAREVQWVDLPGVPDKGDPFDWLAAGNDAADLYDLVEAVGQVWTPDTAFESKFRAIPWAKLREPGFEHEWLVKGLLTRRERSMVAGPSQSGKSFFCLELAMAIARGVDFFGHKVSHPGGVIYQAGEGGRGIKRRLDAYMIDRGVDPSDAIPFVLLPAPLDLYASDDPTNAFIDEVLHWSRTFDVPLELIVIDTFSAASPGANENASEDVSRILARCERIEQATGAHVMLVHHMNADGNKPRGHTSIFANLEQVIVVTNTEEKDDEQIVASFKDGAPTTVRRDIREAKIAKQKDGEAGGVINFVLNAVKIGADEDGDAITSCVIEPPHRSALVGASVQRESGLDVSPQAAAYLRAIYQAISDTGTTPPDERGFPAVTSGVRVVHHGTVRDNFRRTTFEGQGDDPDKEAETIKKAIQRHGSYLLKHGIIRKNGNYIWLTGKKVKGFALNQYSENGVRKKEERSPEPQQYIPEDADDLPF